MLRRYIPGKGYVNLGVKDNKVKIIQSYSTIKGICNLGSFTWNSKIGCCESLNLNSDCYLLPNLDGGLFNSIPNLFMDGGIPSFIGLCRINPTECYNKSSLNGGLPSLLSTLHMDGGSPNYIGLCHINPTECYNKSLLNGGLPSLSSTLNMDGGIPSFIGLCHINQ